MKKRRRYMVSLPERALRASASLTGGLVSEAANVLLPASVRNTRLYRATVAQFLRMVVELVGDVRVEQSEGAMPVKELALRKAAGNSIELASILTMGWSPLWLLAAASDLSRGSRVYLQALVAELQTAGLLAKDAPQIETVDDLLARLEGGAGVAADTLDLPPLDAAALRGSWEALKEHVTQLPHPDRLDEIFTALREAATREGRSLLWLSTIVAGGAVRAGVQLGNVHVFEYYREALGAIGREGVLAYLQRVGEPYVRRAVEHFDPEAPTWTERLLPGEPELDAPAEPDID
jgi:hypothetical protein